MLDEKRAEVLIVSAVAVVAVGVGALFTRPNNSEAAVREAPPPRARPESPQRGGDSGSAVRLEVVLPVEEVRARSGTRELLLLDVALHWASPQEVIADVFVLFRLLEPSLLRSLEEAVSIINPGVTENRPGF